MLRINGILHPTNRDKTAQPEVNIANEVPVGNSEFNDILTADTEICSKNKNTKKIKIVLPHFHPIACVLLSAVNFSN